MALQKDGYIWVCVIFAGRAGPAGHNSQVIDIASSLQCSNASEAHNKWASGPLSVC